MRLFTLKDQHPNLYAYDEVENLDNFTDVEFESYCKDKLMTCIEHCDFLLSHCINESWTGRVCEIGSGNSKLLYSLEKKELLEFGYGIEISTSRYLFAEKFKQYLSSNKVNNINKNIFDLEPLVNMDVVIGVDIVFQLIAPVYPNAELDLLSWIYGSMKSQGHLVLELWDFEHILQQLSLTNNDLELKEHFDASDPFESVLANIKQNAEKDIVWEKKFIKRSDKSISEFNNILRPYSSQQITRVLEDAGFENINIYSKWSENASMAQGEYIVVAQKP